MLKGYRRTAALLAVGIVAALAPIGARATHCDSNVFIFSDTRGVGVAYIGGVVCIADEGEETDSRYLQPGADSVYVRYAEDLGESVTSLTGELNGLGFDHTPITLTRKALTGGTFAYDSTSLDIPAGAGATGCVSATVFLPGSDPDTNTVRSIGATC